MEPNVNVVEHISMLLDSGKYKEALSAPSETKFVDSFKDNCWDLISIVVGKVQDDTIIVKPSLYGACEELLTIIIQKATPEEALLEFIEQVEVAKNDAQLELILGPLQSLLKKLSAKRGRSLEWCLNSICTYIENIPIPDHHLEGKERLLLDSDINIRRITKIYSMLIPFCEPFIKELSGPEANFRSKQVITAFLVSLLGRPLIYIDLDPESNAQSEARQCCQSIIKYICSIERNVCNLLELLEVCYKENLKPKSKSQNIEKTPYEHREKINMTTLSGLAYAVFSGHFEAPDSAVPQVYSIEFMNHMLLLSVGHLLSFTEYGPLAKAIALCKGVFNRMPENVSHKMLAASVNFDTCKSLTNVSIYSLYEPIRKNAVTLIGEFINKFAYKGRCMLIKYLIETANHSGMIGYAITLYKNSLDQALKDTMLNECFTGAQLMYMIKKICYLPHGAESDIIELADQIITTLNFLRYLSIKDVQNKTGIRDSFNFIETDYLDKLRTGLNLSKAHYEVKLKDIEGGKNAPKAEVNVSINVGGNILDQVPAEKKKEIINSALNAFHLIEGLVARLFECINTNKMQALSMDCD